MRSREANGGRRGLRHDLHCRCIAWDPNAVGLVWISVADGCRDE